jgi:quercetin dioxygenase-like cupin family protein
VNRELEMEIQAIEQELTEAHQLEKIDFSRSTEMSKEEIRGLIQDVQNLMVKQEQVETPITNHFSPGVYAREMFIPKGTIVIGKIHKHENMSIMSKGELSIISIDGGVKRVKAPYTVVAPPGVKRMVYAHEDTVWTSIHGTHETDLAKIEEEFIAKNYDEVVEVGDGKMMKLEGE